MDAFVIYEYVPATVNNLQLHCINDYVVSDQAQPIFHIEQSQEQPPKSEQAKETEVFFAEQIQDFKQTQTSELDCLEQPQIDKPMQSQDPKQRDNLTHKSNNSDQLGRSGQFQDSITLSSNQSIDTKQPENAQDPNSNVFEQLQFYQQLQTSETNCPETKLLLDDHLSWMQRFMIISVTVPVAVGIYKLLRK
jgi:hypothetical protein